MRKGLFLALAALAAFGCGRRERDRAREQVREGAGEVREGAERAGEKIQTGAERAAHETREFGRDVREEWRGTEPGAEQPSTGAAPSAAPSGAPSSEQRAKLEAAARRDGYQVTFEENGRISAMKIGGARQPVAGETMNDADVESAIRAKLQHQPGAESILVDAKSGVVTLTGALPADRQAEVIKLVLDQPGVHEVVIEPSSSGALPPPTPAPVTPPAGPSGKNY